MGKEADERYFGTPCRLELQDEKKDRDGLVIAGRGTIFFTSSATYVVEKKLGEGGCGQVFLVTRRFDQAKYALKTEAKHADDSTKRMKAEIHKEGLQKEMITYQAVMRMRRKKPWRVDHLLGSVDSGQNDLFKFVVMPLLGASVKDVLEARKIDFVSALRIAVQMLQGIRQLHIIGFMHRDLKPDNFMFKGGSAHSRLLLMDYGMSTYVDPKDAAPDEKDSAYNFIGTTEYASRASHAQKAQHCKDDLESWIFVVLELFHQDLLPWHRVKGDEEILRVKTFLIEGHLRIIWNVVPKEFKKMLIRIAALKRKDKLPYAILERSLEKMCHVYGLEPFGPFPFMSPLKPM